MVLSALPRAAGGFQARDAGRSRSADEFVMVSAEAASVEARAPVVAAETAASPPFRFYDNRQKYLAFVNTCNEKAAVAARAALELRQLHHCAEAFTGCPIPRLPSSCPGCAR